MDIQMILLIILLFIFIIIPILIFVTREFGGQTKHLIMSIIHTEPL